MALIVMLARRIIQNKWLVASLFAGILLSVALVSSMPIYAEANLSRMLLKDLERLQQDTNEYPGAYYASIELSSETPEQARIKINWFDRFIRTEAAPDFQLPIQELVAELATQSMKMKRANDPNPLTDQNMQWVALRAFSGLEAHIELIDGRMPAAEPKEGVYETLVTERGLAHYKTVLGTVFVIDDDRLAEPIKLRPVGVFRKKADEDPYFRANALNDMNGAFIVPFELAQRQIVNEQRVPVRAAGWYIALDYSRIELRKVQPFLDTHEQIRRTLLKYMPLFQMGAEARAHDTIEAYLERAEQLRKLMWALNAPILTLLTFYMFMVANLIVGRQKNEIAVLRSRGAARWQIVAFYLAEGVLLCVATAAMGPILGAGMTELLGASNGFLEFVQRARLPIRLTEEAYRYAAVAACACLVTLMVPAIAATRVTIVGHKQQIARRVQTSLWHKTFVDFLALGAAFYGLWTFRRRLHDLQQLGLHEGELNLDPLQFAVPALFMLGAGLLLLRLYPWLLRAIYWLGRRWWPPSIYAALLQVGRSSGQYQFLMIFLILTIATGIFSASAARTINANTEERIRYVNGADLVLTVNWVNDAPPPGRDVVRPEASAELAGPRRIHYLEPAYEPYRTLPGVEHAAKVFTKSGAAFAVGDKSGKATLIGIDTDEFGRTAWFRDSLLLAYSFNEYLNLIAADTSAVLISGTLADMTGAKAGDTIWIGWPEAESQPFQVYGVLDYFPTFNPLPQLGEGDGDAKQNDDEIDKEASKESNKTPMLIVGHLSRIQSRLALEPYEIWLKLSDGGKTGQVYEGIQARKLSVSGIVNTREELVRAKNDPFLLALNGVLTMGFVLAIGVSFAGFLLYWILSLKGRTQQNGIMRALGMSLGSLTFMLAVEQLFTSGAAVLFGIAVGNAASLLYVPNFQTAFQPGSLALPFTARFELIDQLRICTLTGAMLATGLAVLSVLLSRLQLHQALKLGED